MLLACVSPISAFMLPLSPARSAARGSMITCEEPGQVAKSSLPAPVQDLLGELDVYDPTTLEDGERDKARPASRAAPRRARVRSLRRPKPVRCLR